MSQARVAVLFNPTAGRGKAGRGRVRMERRLRQMEVRFDLYLTQSEEHLRNLTRELAGHYATLVGAGGDSTFQIMVEELMNLENRPTLGIIGLGSSNDIPREFGVGTLERACLALKRGLTKKIDIGCLQQGEKVFGYFLGQANIGLGVAVNRQVEELFQTGPWLGRKQTLAGLLAIRKIYQQKEIPWPLEVRSAAGRVRANFAAVVFSNIRYWATGKLINPGARVDDGLLDACLIQDCSFTCLVRLAALAQKGKHGRAKEVSFLRAPGFTVRSERPFAIQVDGQIPGGWTTPRLFTEIEVRLLPSSLPIIHGVGPR